MTGCPVFSPGFFEGVVGGGAGIKREEREKEKLQKGEEKKETRRSVEHWTRALTALGKVN